VLEIIGWMLCVYLFVKGCELLTMKRQEGRTEQVVAYLAGFGAIAASLLFFWLVTVQAETTSQLSAPSNPYSLP